jgi:hypothetical protein
MVDTLDSGSSERKLVEVQVLSRPPGIILLYSPQRIGCGILVGGQNSGADVSSPRQREDDDI